MQATHQSEIWQRTFVGGFLQPRCSRLACWLPRRLLPRQTGRSIEFAYLESTRERSRICNAGPTTRRNHGLRSSSFWLKQRPPVPGMSRPETEGPDISCRGPFSFSSMILARSLFLHDRILGPRRKAFVIFEGFLGELDGSFELRVMTADDQVWPLRYNVVRIHAVVFHDPFAAIVC